MKVALKHMVMPRYSGKTERVKLKYQDNQRFGKITFIEESDMFQKKYWSNHGFSTFSLEDRETSLFDVDIVDCLIIDNYLEKCDRFKDFDLKLIRLINRAISIDSNKTLEVYLYSTPTKEYNTLNFILLNQEDWRETIERLTAALHNKENAKKSLKLDLMRKYENTTFLEILEMNNRFLRLENLEIVSGREIFTEEKLKRYKQEFPIEKYKLEVLADFIK